MSSETEDQPAETGVHIPTAKDGTLLLPSAFKDAGERPRFRLPVPRPALRDVAVRFLVEREAYYGGYEYPTRAFFDAHLAAGDLFIDVGAHWGIMSLSAATRHRGDVKVLAIEAHPLNVVQLMRAITYNGLEASIEVVAAAAGVDFGTAPLVANSSMGHSLYGLGLQGMPQGDFKLAVPTVTLDRLMAERPELAERRCFLKIDVEGFEPQVVAGAAELLESGRVAALVWEKGRAFDREPGHGAMLALVARLKSLGFTLHVMPSGDLGGPLLPFVPAQGSHNVFCLAPGFQPEAAYLRPPGPVPAPAGSSRGSDDPEERSRLTKALAAVKGSDHVRWSDPAELVEGAAERAALAAPFLRPGEAVLDLGAGAMRLRALLPESASYLPVDLIPFSPDTLCVDLNQGQLPGETADVVVALELLEYMHDVPALLARMREAAPRLICTYRCRGEESSESRRRHGWFNDYGEAELRALLEAAGWRIEHSEAESGLRLFVCARPETASASPV
ncbi:MAG: FkbM family methyltransferase [Kiloniellales bacterium]